MGFATRLRPLSLLVVIFCCAVDAQQPPSTTPSHKQPIAPLQNLIRFNRIMVEDGLSNNVVKCILQDKYGFMWFGTQSGLNRYDGKSIRVYKTTYRDSTTLWYNDITSLAEDREGNLWVASYGLQRYDRENDNFVRYNVDTTGEKGPLPGALYLACDSSRVLWIASWAGLQQFNPQTNIFKKIELGNKEIRPWAMSLDREGNVLISSIYNGQYIRVDKTDLSYQTFTFESHFQKRPNEHKTKIDNPSGIFADEKNNLWAYGYGTVYKFDWRNNIFHAVLDSSERHAFNIVVKDSMGRMWAGTYTEGLRLLEEKSKEKHSLINSANPNSLSGMTVISAYVDRIGNVWLGTERGVSIMARWSKPFVYYSPSIENSQYSSIGEINAIREDSAENIWTTRHVPSNVDRLDRVTGTFKHYAIPATARQLFVDTDGVLLVSSFPSPMKYDPRHDRFYKLQFHPNTWKGHYYDSFPPDDYLREADGTKWFGYDNKFARVDNRGSVRWYSTADGLPRVKVEWIYKDREGRVWVNPSDNGIARYDRVHDRFIASAKTDFHAHLVFEDSEGNFWIGTESELRLYDRKADSTIRYFNRMDGLGPIDGVSASLGVLGILEDAHKNLWLQTDVGIAKLNIHTLAARYFGPGDGIPAPSRNRYHVVGTGAHVKTKRGEMVFGLGANGIVMFYPDDIKDNPKPPRIILTDFKLFNEPAKIGKDFPLKKSITLSDRIELTHDQNEFTFEFAALDYTAPSENQYAYRLDGYDKDWVKSGNRNIAYYTNISPGKYTFHVKASNNDGVWNEEGISIALIIAPPWWKTAWAYTGYIISVFTLLFFARRYELNRQQHKHAAQIEHLETEKLKEVDRVKTRFFANISHEFRTPLTLIEGPAKQIHSGDPKIDPKENAGIIIRNAQRLLRLVNQLLDLSKIESGGLKLKKQSMDIVRLVKEIGASFESLAARKEIKFEIKSEKNSVVGNFDSDVVEKIVTNLLSNAFKFTEPGGTVRLNLHLNLNLIFVSVTDTGIGIPSDQLEKIFDRFYQVDASQTRAYEGTGIGLSLTKELVELHGGRISVSSDPGRGSTFTVQLPLEHDTSAEAVQNAERREELSYDSISGEMKLEHAATIPDDSRPSLLIIEDNADMRHYIRTHLEAEYTITEAKNGVEGAERAIADIPDIIISDVMMPKMGGFEVCEKLKTDQRTSHIPIILLTAKAGQEHKIEGLETGADDYLVKPFDAKELIVRLSNLLDTRKRIREHFQRELTLLPAGKDVPSADERFLKKVFDTIEAHFSDAEFDLSSLSDEAMMSRTQLHRKLKAITGYSPGELIRNIRLQRAAELIKKKAGTVSEIAYRVGFNNLSYFAKSFREKYGVNPSEYH